MAFSYTRRWGSASNNKHAFDSCLLHLNLLLRHNSFEAPIHPLTESKVHIHSYLQQHINNKVEIASTPFDQLESTQVQFKSKIEGRLDVNSNEMSSRHPSDQVERTDSKGGQPTPITKTLEAWFRGSNLTHSLLPYLFFLS